ncbi:NAD(P)-dependent oxidoreductase [Niallia taxi]|uniref:NAD(P)-dependent oxidoreductase n=1 Tax=Niallia taxi TaxID=2499688 RepID=A0A437K3D5_9BACI|nr:NAD(P)-dependent oxidoreductase [Niallia taxi]MCM3214513.1 NAD(P)-dependent oxidoreductase [Niallia taxi]RVT56644.1 NAD(P)-dependent oxidoreductase [Niallia taxi]
MKVALIGLGNMGLPIAENILKSGHKLVIYNRTASKLQSLVEKGAEMAVSPADAAQKATIVFTILSDDKAAEAVVYGEKGIISGLPKDGIHVSVSTLSVELAKKLEEDHQKNSQAFVSCPVLGRPDAAAAAALRLLVAGPKQAREKIMPVLNELGKDIFVVGEKGHLANVVKLGNNFLIVSMLEALSEAFVFVEKYGIKADAFLEIANTLFASPVYQNYGKIMVEERFEEAGFKLALGLKDVNLMLEAAHNAKISLPTAEIAKKHYEEGIEQGWSDLDWAAIVKLLREKSEH